MSLIGTFFDNVFGGSQLTERDVTFTGPTQITAMQSTAALLGAERSVDYGRHEEAAKQGMSPTGHFTYEFFNLIEAQSPDLDLQQKQEVFAQAFERFSRLEPNAQDEVISKTRQLAEQFRSGADPEALSQIKVDHVVDALIPEQGRPVGDIHKLVGENDEFKSIRAELQSLGVAAGTGISAEHFKLAAQTVQDESIDKDPTIQR